jgi:predicted RNase H-like HicB family nuclease
MRTYSAVVARDTAAGLYVGHGPGFPGAHRQGGSPDELHRKLQEVVAVLPEGGEPPLEAEFVGTRTLRVA